jgi:hypothetical protein
MPRVTVAQAKPPTHHRTLYRFAGGVAVYAEAPRQALESVADVA